MDETDESERTARLQRRNTVIENNNGDSIDSQLQKFGCKEPGMNQTEKEEMLKVLQMSALEQGGPSQVDETLGYQDMSGPSNGNAMSPVPDSEPLDATYHFVDTSMDVEMVPESPLMNNSMNDPETDDEETVRAADASLMYADVFEKLSKATKAKPRCMISDVDPWIRPGSRPEDLPLVRKNWTVRQSFSGRRRWPSRHLTAWLERLSNSYRQRRLAQPQPYPPEWGKAIEAGRHMPDTIDAFRQLPVRRQRVPENTLDDHSNDSTSDDLVTTEPTPVNKPPLLLVDEELPDLVSPSSTIIHSETSESSDELPPAKKPEPKVSTTPAARPALRPLGRPNRTAFSFNASVIGDPEMVASTSRLRPTTTCYGTKMRLATQRSPPPSTSTNSTWHNTKSPVSPPELVKNKTKPKRKEPVVMEEDIPALDDYFQGDKSGVAPGFGNRPPAKVVSSRRGLGHAINEANRNRPKLSDPAADDEPVRVLKVGVAVKTYGSRPVRKREASRTNLTDRPRPPRSPSPTEQSKPGPSKRLRTTFTGSLKDEGGTAAVPTKPSVYSDEDDEDPFERAKPNTSNVVKRDKRDDVQCPMCSLMFPADIIETHAAGCQVDEDDDEPRALPSGRTTPNTKRCYVCRNFYQENDYAAHVFDCIATREREKDMEQGNVETAFVTPERADVGKPKVPQFGKSLLSRLTASEVGGSTGNTVLNTVREGCLKRKYERMRNEALGGPSTPITLQDISINHVAMSPLETFVPISKQTNSLIDYKNQFSYKTTSVRVKSGAKKTKKKYRKRGGKRKR